MRRLYPAYALIAGLALVGCEDKSTKVADSGGLTKSAKTTVAEKHDHNKYWCPEHGIPEEDCLMCKFDEPELKKKGDWCDEHKYPKSQCFACDPKLRERYAAQYRAKFGKEPPEPTENPKRN
ncbi:MAG TPA: hypothetical protein VKD71_06465 [Gemmataceae bacterium]|nr:hypothetical protein [Gemmataceae bacterium]